MIIDKSFLHDFISEHAVKDLGAPKFNSKGIPVKFVLNYYDSYTFFVLVDRQVRFLTDEFFIEIKLHKKKLFVEIIYTGNQFILSGVYFKSLEKKSKMVIFRIKLLLKKQLVGTSIIGQGSVKGVNGATYVCISLNWLNIPKPI